MRVSTLRHALIACLLLALVGLQLPAQAALGSCSATITPHSLGTNVTGTLTVSVNNTDANTVNWVRVTAASDQFEIISGSADGWSGSVGAPTEITFTGGTIDPSGTTDFSLTVQTGSTPVSAQNWTVQASDTGGSSGSATCSGDTSVAITGADTTAPAISNISVTNITTSGATVTWTTDEAATSRVDYGTTTSYGSNASSSSLVTSHSLTLSGLSSNTTYHYKISSTDAANNQAQSADNTFVTAKPSPTPTPTPTPTPAASTTTPTPTATATPTPTPIATPRTTIGSTPTPTPTPEPTPPPIRFIPDTTAPTATLNADIPSPTAEEPLMTGSASDDRGLANVEYSVDGGQNWLPVDNLPTRDGNTVTFEFRPATLPDGNYTILARATDTAGNTGLSEPVTLVIDRLPPRLGASLLASGAQVIKPTLHEPVVLVASQDQTVTLGALGGPTTVDINVATPEGEQTFSLVLQPDTGLWSGTVSIATPGSYIPRVRLRDGANNETISHLAQVQVVPPGRVQGAAGPIADAELTVYYFDPLQETFVIWDGAPFEQTNPQRTDSNGHYHLRLPAGRYYLHVTAPGFRPLQTEIVTFNRSQPLTASLTLARPRQLVVGTLKIPLPVWQPDLVTLPVPPMESTTNTPAGLVQEQTIPTIVLETMDGPLTTAQLGGQTRLISLLNTWSPLAAEQLPVLNTVATDSHRHAQFLVVMSQESLTASELLRRRGNYEVPFAADPLGELAQALGVPHVPTHLVLNQQGNITHIVVGVLSAEEITQLLLY